MWLVYSHPPIFAKTPLVSSCLWPIYRLVYNWAFPVVSMQIRVCTDGTFKDGVSLLGIWSLLRNNWRFSLRVRCQVCYTWLSSCAYLCWPVFIRNDFLDSLADACHFWLLRLSLLRNSVDIAHAVTNINIQVFNVCYRTRTLVTQESHQVCDALLVLLVHTIVNGQLTYVVILNYLLFYTINRDIWSNFIALRLESKVRSHTMGHCWKWLLG